MKRFYDYLKPTYNSFDIKFLNAHNKRRIRALLRIQADIINEVLTDKQKTVIEYVIVENLPQKVVAEMLEISPSSVCRRLKCALRKIRPYLEFCDDSLRYYEREGDD